jgi:light-regulated signal transduction histidine kinase (bacteriophytochrome)
MLMFESDATDPPPNTATPDREHQLISQIDALTRQATTLTTQLQNVTDELDALAYAVSHDLRAPLRSIEGFTEIIVQDFGATLAPEADGYLHRVQAATQRMSGMLDDLLTLSRLIRREMNPTRVDLSVIAGRVMAGLCKTDQHLQVNFYSTDDLWVTADPALIEQALYCLLHNAWKFTGRNSNARIEIGMQVSDDRSIYFVRDNGIGFPMDLAHKLFQPFQVLHAELDLVGRMIGLAAVQRIIHRHGGLIWAESSLQQSATFLFTLSSMAETI